MFQKSYAYAERVAEFLARALAIAGGAVLLVIATLTCISIIGRAMVPFQIGIGPIRGIYDITSICMAVAIFAFLPWAQFKDTHAKVDLFKAVMPDWADRALQLFFNIAMTIFAFIMTWRLYLGAVDKRSFGETTLIAGIPVWIGFALGLVGAIGFCIVSLFCVWRSAYRLVQKPQSETAHV